tara:strand:- start:821 stop:1858 length:1038 start_codon:yes stop_codon:yes gene_type:complete
MKFLSVCSGIEAASCAWDWEAVAFSEIEKFPSQVLSHHYPETPNWGDMTKFKEWPDANVDVLVGGTPCQSFSVAGLRKGLDDPRGNLMLTYLAIAAKYRPKWVVWENVPGVLSSNGGLDFASFLRGLAECGYGFAYRVLDAQYFGVPQLRRRVFVVGCFGDWRSAAAVLFEQHSLQGHSAPSRKTGKDLAKCLTTSTQRYDPETETLVTQPIPIDTMNHIGRKDSHSFGDFEPGAPSYTLTKGHSHAVAQPTIVHGTQDPCVSDIAFAQGRNNGGENVMVQSMAVRRFTPVECERLQGFPDGYTDIQLKGKPTPDGPRYKALGNSMAVPVMRWIGQRIEAVDRIK